MLRTLTIPLLIALSIDTGVAQDGRATLPELARRFAPRPVFQSKTRELVLLPPDYVLPKSDLVVYGTVVSSSTYLSEDQKDLYTDYALKPIRIIRSRMTAAAAVPGIQIMPTITVRRWGGELTIEGVTVTQEDHDFRALKTGEHVVLFLEYDKEAKKYRLPSSASAAFVVEGAIVRPLLKQLEDSNVFDHWRGKTVAQFESEVHRIDR